MITLILVVVVVALAAVLLAEPQWLKKFMADVVEPKTTVVTPPVQPAPVRDTMRPERV